MGKLWIVHFPPPFNASPYTKDCACFDNWESSHSCQQSMTWERRPSCQKEQTRTNCLDYRQDWCQATDAASSSFSPSFWCLLWQMQSFPAQFLTSSDAESSFYQTYAHASSRMEWLFAKVTSPAWSAQGMTMQRKTLQQRTRTWNAFCESHSSDSSRLAVIPFLAYPALSIFWKQMNLSSRFWGCKSNKGKKGWDNYLVPCCASIRFFKHQESDQRSRL